MEPCGTRVCACACVGAGSAGSRAGARSDGDPLPCGRAPAVGSAAAARRVFALTWLCPPLGGLAVQGSRRFSAVTVGTRGDAWGRRAQGACGAAFERAVGGGGHRGRLSWALSGGLLGCPGPRGVGTRWMRRHRPHGRHPKPQSGAPRDRRPPSGRYSPREVLPQAGVPPPPQAGAPPDRCPLRAGAPAQVGGGGRWEAVFRQDPGLADLGVQMGPRGNAGRKQALPGAGGIQEQGPESGLRCGDPRALPRLRFRATRFRGRGGVRGWGAADRSGAHCGHCARQAAGLQGSGVVTACRPAFVHRL